MPSYLSSNELFQALPLLEKFETKTTIGAMASPFYAINRIRALLERAMAKGDCIAPYFLHYMRDAGYYQIDNIDELPDLNMVPSHRSRGKTWVDAYKLYLNTLEELSKLEALSSPLPSEPQNRRGVSATQARLMLVQAERRKTASKTKIDDNLSTLAKLKHPISDLFCAKLFEKMNCARPVAETFYQQAAIYPNVWAMQEYWEFLQRTPSRRISPEHYRLLEEELNLLQQANENWGGLLEHFLSQNNTDKHSQWYIHASLHGELNHSLSFTLSYVTGKMDWIYPITSAEALNEALKWFHWLSSKYVEHYHFPIIVMDTIFSLFSDVEEHTHEMYVLMLHMIDYVNRMLLIPGNVALFSSEDILQFIQLMEENCGKVCHYVYTKNPRLPLLQEHYHFSSTLALFFEKQDNLKMAEQWYRKALRLMPDDAIGQYNLANILLKQKKELQETIELFLKAAESGCQDSFLVLLNFIFRRNFLSANQIDRCIAVIQTVLSDLQTLKFATDLNAQSHPLIPWLYAARQYKIYNGDFKIWKKFASETLLIETAKKEQWLQDAFAAYAIQDKTETISSIHAALSNATEDANDDDIVDVDDFSDIVAEPVDAIPQTETPVFEMKMQRALEQLNALREKPMRNLTMRDRVELEQCFVILMNAPGIRWSTKGHTSGSRIAINGETLHLPHGHDRMSPGAQQNVKRKINAVVEEVQQAMPAAFS